jgi:hypothetical protein
MRSAIIGSGSGFLPKLAAELPSSGLPRRKGGPSNLFDLPFQREFGEIPIDESNG